MVKPNHFALSHYSNHIMFSKVNTKIVTLAKNVKWYSGQRLNSFFQTIKILVLKVRVFQQVHIFQILLLSVLALGALAKPQNAFDSFDNFNQEVDNTLGPINVS